jgi:Restriction endonuclease AspBHI N-terminal/Restriction endonuclease
MKNISYYEIEFNKLVIDSTYEDSREPGSPINGQPLLKLFPGIGNMKGIRVVGNTPSWKLYVLTSTESESDWPDSLDEATGLLTYWGDNRTPGKEMHDQPGNRFFREIFARAASGSDERKRVPPGFYFTHGDHGRDMVFRGMIIPKTNEVANSEELISVWRSSYGKRFQNYRARFTVLNATEIDLRWVRSVIEGKELKDLAPLAWKSWIEKGIIKALEAPRTLEYRKKASQLPTGTSEVELLKLLHSYFEGYDSLFEHFAVTVWRMSDSRVSKWRVTRPTRDGGRDAIGEYRIGPDTEPISLDWALEAKRYEPGKTSVGVADLARLISRLRFRQFGILVTTSFVSDQAYKEIREDQHPIIVIAGVDIVGILKQVGIATIDELQSWLETNFHRDVFVMNKESVIG